MKWKFGILFRLYIAVLAGFLAWSFWAQAQGTNTTNTTSAPAALEKPRDTDLFGVDIIPDQAWLTFGMDRIPFLQHELPKGIPLWQYPASLIYIFLAFYLSKLLDFLTRVYLKRWTSKTKSNLDDLILDIVNGPTKIIAFVILLHIGLNVFHWPSWLEEIFSKVLKIVVAISITYTLLRLVDLSLGYWRNRASADTDKTFDEQLFPIIRKSLKAFIIIVATLLTSHNLGVNITSVIASLSIGGLALGLAAQDTLANLFGAISVFIDKPFRVGDAIRIDQATGTVESIGLRSTRVRNADGHLITIPNKTMGNATITNITSRPSIKTIINIGLTYDTTPEKMRQAVKILEEIYRSNKMTTDVLIAFNQFGDSALNIQVVHLWGNTNNTEYVLGMQEMNLAIKARFDAEGINFAFPTRTLYVKQDSEWRMGGVAGLMKNGGEEPMARP